MKVLVATDAHIYKTPDGKYWSKYIYGYNFWMRYMNVFDSVRIVARVKNIKATNSKLELVSGEKVEVYEIPFYQGPLQLLKKYVKIQKCLKGVSDGCDVALFRMPSQTAQMTYDHTDKSMPIAGEIVYNQYEDVQNSKNFIIKLLNIRMHRNLIRFCSTANGVSYVTNDSIQRNYPSYSRTYGSDVTHFESAYSTITLSEKAYTSPRDYTGIKKLCAVLSDVAMNGERKGERTLIKAIKEGRDRGYDLSAIIIGDGSMRTAFETYAKELGVSDFIKFTGLLPTSDAVREVMLQADVFVFPTQGEGLPRGILEAMAIGMPVLSTPVGGIPEVLDEYCLFAPNDSFGFSMAMCSFLDDPRKMTELSKKNFEISQQFKNSILQKRRDEFYGKLRNLAESRNYE